MPQTCALTFRPQTPCVAPEGIEPSPTGPKPVVLPLYHRAIERKQKDFSENRQTLGIIQTSLVSALAKGAFEPSEPIWFNTLAMCRFRPLSHTSIKFRVQKYYRPMKSFFVAKENLVFFRKNIIMLRYRGCPLYLCMTDETGQVTGFHRFHQFRNFRKAGGVVENASLSNRNKRCLQRMGIIPFPCKHL